MMSAPGDAGPAGAYCNADNTKAKPIFRSVNGRGQPAQVSTATRRHQKSRALRRLLLVRHSLSEVTARDRDLCIGCAISVCVSGEPLQCRGCRLRRSGDYAAKRLNRQIAIDHTAIIQSIEFNGIQCFGFTGRPQV